MDVAVVHFHLNRGGVMQVIAGHLRALDAALPPGERLRVLLLYGGRREGWPEGLPAELPQLDVSLAEVAGLDYDDDAPPRPDELAASIRAALAAAGMRLDATILHVHNHNLGKNVSLPGALGRLAADGGRLLLQIHDFAEDLRPTAYRRLRWALGSDDRALGDDGAAADSEHLDAALYPQAAQIHYAHLNGRDGRLLSAAGVPDERRHLLANPVSELGPLPTRAAARDKLAAARDVPADRPLWLYPVRGITRKNVGELLLWGAASGGRAHVGITLPPLNPAERGQYLAWRDLARELDLPVAFELGEPLTFRENLAAADGLLTTSLAEGFGMVFLETWLANRPLAGRDLPEITADFVAAGVAFPGLAPRLDVPLDWIGATRFCTALLAAYRRTLAAYGRAAEESALEDQLEWLIAAGDGPPGGAEGAAAGPIVDFGTLDHELQAEVVRRIAASGSDRETLLALNPRLAEALARRPSGGEGDDTLARNAEVVRRAYGVAACGRRLRDVYARLAESEPVPLGAPARGAAILDALLDLSRFRPLRAP